VSKPGQPAARVFLVRHGVADGAADIAVGQVDLPLSAAVRGVEVEMMNAERFAG
jgi:hypothetical protein